MIVGTLDVCVLPEQAFKPLQKGIATATGIPPNHINLSATHTHSAPPLTGLFLNDAETDYLEWMMDTVIDGVIKISHQPEEPVRIGWARAPIPEHVFNRRWLLKEGANYENPFGSHEDRVRMNPGYGNPDISQPSGPTDPILEVLGISRSDGSPLALIGNYSLHYVGGVNGISADYFGAYGNWLKQYFQREYPNKPFVGLLTNGASGDINNLNYALPTPPPKKPPYQKIKEVAQSVASKTAELFEQMSWETARYPCSPKRNHRVPHTAPGSKSAHWKRNACSRKPATSIRRNGPGRRFMPEKASFLRHSTGRSLCL